MSEKYGRVEKYYITDEDIVTIKYRNFGRKSDDFNPEGPKYSNFWVVLTEKKADELRAEGFNIRERENQDGDIEFRLQVFISGKDEWFPKIIKKCNGRKTVLDRESMATLDRDELERVDLAITKGRWEFNGRSGIKAWLNVGEFEIVYDSFGSMDDDYDEDDEPIDDLPFK